MDTKHLQKFPYLRKRRPNSVIVVCHRKADPDAYGSAYAVAYLLKYLYKDVRVKIGTPGGISKLAAKIGKIHRSSLVESPVIPAVDLIVVVDTGHKELLADWGELLSSSEAIKVFVDHHPLDESIKILADHLVVDTSVSSACELVYKIFKVKQIPLKRRVAEVLLIGILFDSHHLAIAGYKTIKVVTELCENGASIVSAKKLLSSRREHSEVVARLKAAQRVKLFEVGEWIAAVSKVGSYHASSSGALIGLGADVALTMNHTDGYTKGSLRASQIFHKDTRIHLGKDVASKVKSELGDGYGGGHPTAASFTVKEPMGKIESLVLKLLSDKLDDVVMTLL